MVIPGLRADYRRVTEHFAGDSEEPPRLAWLSGTLIAVISRRINGYLWKNFFISTLKGLLLTQKEFFTKLYSVPIPHT